MREELKRNNSIGNKSGIDYLVETIFNSRVMSVDAIKKTKVYPANAILNYNVALSFLEELEYIRVLNNRITLLNKGLLVMSCNINDRKHSLIESVADYLFDNNIIDTKQIIFDISNKCILLKSGCFPLYSAIFRNFLISLSVIITNGEGNCCVSYIYKNCFWKHIKEANAKRTLNELILQLETQRKQGAVGEQFALEFEIKRLNAEDLKPQIISDIDVCAGYDLVSYMNNDSTVFDKFIEVKTYTGEPHFYWSNNEKDTAIVKRGNYFIYLVDVSKINDNHYVPIIIVDPINALQSDEWVVEPNSFLVRRT